MSQKKRRTGLQHGLSDILKEQQSLSLEEKSQYTARLLSEVTPRQETRAQQSLVTESPVDQQSPVTIRHAPTIDQQAPVTISHPSPESEKNYIKVPHLIVDKLIASLDPYEFKVYLRLFRLSHGFHQTRCLVGYKALADGSGLSPRHVKRVIPRLVTKGLVKIMRTYNDSDTKGTLYEVLTGAPQTPVTISHQSRADTGVRKSPNKIDDDLLKDIDHHQRETMNLYHKLTGNTWRKPDREAYQKIKDIPLEKIEQGIQLALERAKSHPNSLQYFVKEILRRSDPGKKNRAQRKKELQKIVDRLRNLHIGAGNYRIADLAEDAKRVCVQEGVPFDNDLFSEILGLG